MTSLPLDADLLEELESVDGDLDEVPDEVPDELTPEFVADLIDKCLLFNEVLVGHELHPYQEPLARRMIESVLINDGEEITALAARQCLDGDTVVFRRDGTAVRLSEHEDAWSTGIKATKRYQVHGGAEIVATDNHPVMTDRGWVKAGDLVVGDRVATLAGWDRWGRADTSDGAAGTAEFLGYLVTDGSGRWKDGNGQSPKFTNTRAEYLDEVEYLAKELFGISGKRYAKGNGFDLLLTRDDRRRGNPVDQWLSAQEIDHGFPTAVFGWDAQRVARFVNRAWAGDGCVRTKGPSQPDVFLACGNDEVYARYWQALLAKFGIDSTVKREIMAKGTGTFHRLVVGGGSVRRFFGVVGEVFGKEEGSRAALESCAVEPVSVEYADGCVDGLLRHLFTVGGKPGIGGFIGEPVRRCVRCGADNTRTVKARTRRSAVARVFADLPTSDGERFTFRRVVSIEDAGEREVFDVEYPGKGWFVAQGVYVHNSGKTETVADVVATLMILLPRLAKIYPDLLGRFSEGLWVGMFAPVEGQVETMFTRTVTRLTSERAREIMGDPEVDDKPTRGGSAVKTVRLAKSGSYVSMMTANPRAKIESKTFHLVIIDEAQDSDDRVVAKSIGPMLAYNAGTMVKTGTPTTHKNHFYRSIQLNKRRFAAKKGARQNHFGWDWKDVAKVNPNYERFIRKEMLRIGEDSDEFQMCVAPETRVLTADLRHVPASEVRVGMELVGFDEHVPSFNAHRKFRTSIVEAVDVVVLPAYRITLSDGTAVVASADHPWLVRTSGRRVEWRKTRDLASQRYTTKGDLPRIIRATEVWDEDPLTYERGYLAAAFDGEGHLSSLGPGSLVCGFSQKENAMLQQVRKYLGDLGFITYERVQAPSDVVAVTLAGGSSRIAEFLGRIRPERLVDKFRPEMLGSLTRRGSVPYVHPMVTSVQYLGPTEVVAFRTSTRTFVAEGLASHNSYSAKWLLERGMFTSQHVMDELGDTSMNLVRSWFKTPVVVGVDPARKTDSTVVTVVWVDWDRPDEYGYYDHRILNWLELQGDDWEEQYAKIVDFLSHYNVLAVAVDANGVGDAVAQRLRLLLPRAEVHSITSSQAEQSRRYKHLLALMERRMIGWPAHANVRRTRLWRKFQQQMLDAERIYKGQFFTVKAPDEVWAHDDFVDSLSLACSNTAELQMPSVEVVANPFFG